MNTQSKPTFPIAALIAGLALLTWAPACEETTEDPPCVPPYAVVTDIDETLTTEDEEFLKQLADGTHDPAMRPDADTLMNGYADLGYTVVYLTARGELLTLDDGRSGRDATQDWLQDHGFPWDESMVFLSPEYTVAGQEAVDFKSSVMEDLTADGWTFEWGYGNSDSDIWAFQEGGVADDHLFLVGELAGEMGVVGIPDEDAYTNHMDTQLSGLEQVSCDPED